MGCLLVVIIAAFIGYQGLKFYAIGMIVKWGCIIGGFFLLCFAISKIPWNKISKKVKETSIGSSMSALTKKQRIILAAVIGVCWVCCMMAIGNKEVSYSDGITLEAVSYKSIDSFIGIEYDVKHQGVVVTNNKDIAINVSINADYYDDTKTIVGTKTDKWTGPIAPGQSRYIEIEPIDFSSYVNYYVGKQERVKDYIMLSAGFDEEYEVFFEVDEESDGFFIHNQTTYDIYGGCQFIYYNKDGEIVYVQKESSNGVIEKGKTMVKHFEMMGLGDDRYNMRVYPYAYYAK